MSRAFLSQESPILDSYIAQYICLREGHIILVQRGFEQNNLNFTRMLRMVVQDVPWAGPSGLNPSYSLLTTLRARLRCTSW